MAARAPFARRIWDRWLPILVGALSLFAALAFLNRGRLLPARPKLARVTAADPSTRLDERPLAGLDLDAGSVLDVPVRVDLLLPAAGTVRVLGPGARVEILKLGGRRGDELWLHRGGIEAQLDGAGVIYTREATVSVTASARLHLVAREGETAVSVLGGRAHVEGFARTSTDLAAGQSLTLGGSSTDGGTGGLAR